MFSQRCLVYSRLASLVVPTILAMVVAVSTAQAQSTVGTITQVKGAVSIQRGASNVEVVPNLPVQLHDKIVTQPDASVTVGLIDNSSIQLGPSTTLSIDESTAINGIGAPSKMTLLGGTFLFPERAEIALTGADFRATLDNERVDLWSLVP